MHISAPGGLGTAWAPPGHSGLPPPKPPPRPPPSPLLSPASGQWIFERSEHPAPTLPLRLRLHPATLMHRPAPAQGHPPRPPLLYEPMNKQKPLCGRRALRAAGLGTGHLGSRRRGALPAQGTPRDKTGPRWEPDRNVLSPVEEVPARGGGLTGAAGKLWEAGLRRRRCWGRQHTIPSTTTLHLRTETAGSLSQRRQLGLTTPGVKGPGLALSGGRWPQHPWLLATSLQLCLSSQDLLPSLCVSVRPPPSYKDASHIGLTNHVCKDLTGEEQMGMDGGTPLD